jgi:hypothetical protein
MQSVKRLSKEEREKIAEELRYPFGRVELQCDKYKVSLHVRPSGERRQTIAVYVDGWIRGEWLMTDCEERRRFMRRTEHFILTPKERQQYLKAFGKRAAKRYDIDRKYEMFHPNWNAVRSMLQQFCAANSTVTVLAIGYRQCTTQVAVDRTLPETAND